MPQQTNPHRPGTKAAKQWDERLAKNQAKSAAIKAENERRQAAPLTNPFRLAPSGRIRRIIASPGAGGHPAACWRCSPGHHQLFGPRRGTTWGGLECH